ncbi:unnamed protein product, partial [Ixodes hexagonus]
MYVALSVVMVLLVLHRSCASTPHIEQNPALQKYQNETACFPLEERWFIKYRNKESDSMFGGTAKCVRFSETDPGEDGAYPVILEYEPDVSIDLTVTLSSSPGYTAQNILNFRPQGQNISAQAISAYKDVKKCDVLRLPYAGGKFCSFI